MMVLKDGIFKRTAEGARMISNLSFRSPSKMIDTEDGLLIGLEAELVSDGINHGRQLIELPTFASRANLTKFCAGRSAVFSGSETQAGVVQLLLSRSAIKGNRVIYITRKEGLDIVQNPTVRDKVQKTWEYDKTGTKHDRDITTDHGWKIVLSRGLDVFQRYELNEAFNFANRLQQHRQCKEFNLTFVKLQSSQSG
jgi:hypothetical protein